MRRRKTGSCPSDLSRSQIAADRRHCHTIALWTGASVRRSQTTVVSRWLVIPIAAIRSGASWAAASARRTTPSVVCQIASGSCSTQPGCG